MSRAIGLSVQGGEALARALVALPDRVRRNQLLKVLREAADPIRDRAVGLAPRDPHEPNPHLRDSIVIQSLPIGSYDAEAAVAVGPSPRTFWGLFVEFGYGPNRSPHPFMRPAFDYGTNKALEYLGEALGRLLTQANAGTGVFDAGA